MTSTPTIEIKDVTKTFKDITAVNNLTLTIGEGEFVALLGPNGAGKTTLIEMIEGIQKPDRGSISILGMNWKEHEHSLHRVIGLSLQETKFIDKITTEETLNLFGSFYGLNRKRTEEVHARGTKRQFGETLAGQRRAGMDAAALFAIGEAVLLDPAL